MAKRSRRSIALNKMTEVCVLCLPVIVEEERFNKIKCQPKSIKVRDFLLLVFLLMIIMIVMLNRNPNRVVKLILIVKRR